MGVKVEGGRSSDGYSTRLEAAIRADKAALR